jgi:hypothetical protein
VTEKEDGLAEAVLFNRNGNYEYTVRLDYSGVDQKGHDPRGWAVAALRQSTEKGVSGVRFTEVPEGWHLVVFEPHTGHPVPVMVTGGLTGLGQLFGSARGAVRD